MTLLLLLFAVTPLLPNYSVSPGAIDPAVTQANIHQTICKPGGYTSAVRNVSVKLKAAIYKRDGRLPDKGICCEVDHIISLELGGSNDAKNLWAQPYEPRPGAHEKDAVEDRLHAMVCREEITLAGAQHQISVNWYEVYRRLFVREWRIPPVVRGFVYGNLPFGLYWGNAWGIMVESFSIMDGTQYQMVGH